MAPRRGTRGTRVRRARLLVGFAVCAAFVSGCGEADPLTPPGRFAEDVDLSGQTFTVTGKAVAASGTTHGLLVAGAEGYLGYVRNQVTTLKSTVGTLDRAMADDVAVLAVRGAEQILRREVDARVHADLLARLKTEL